MSTPRVSIVHERFTEFAGSEQVVAQLARIWPEAEVVAPIAQPSNMPDEWAARIRHTSLSRLLRPGGGYAHLLPALPVAMRRLRLDRPDLVVASHHAFADQVVYATPAPVVAYVHSPARWVWDPAMRAGEAGGALGGAALGSFAAAYRPLDRRAAGRLRAIMANSTAVAGRIERWWDRSSDVVHPPVATDFYTPDETVRREDFLLLAGRLVPYKRPDLAIRAAERAGRRLVVAGDGRMRAECEQLAGANTEFLGRVSDEELRSLFRRCAALLMPGVEDFGIVPVEAQACGAPVIATGSGGALDTVVPGVSGRLVAAGEAELLDEAALTNRWVEALKEFDGNEYDQQKIRAHAEKFSENSFRFRVEHVVARVLQNS